MFNINLLNKPGVQNKFSNNLDPNKENNIPKIKQKTISDKQHNYFENIVLPIIIIMFFVAASVFYFNTKKNNEIYAEISIANILQVLEMKSNNIYLESMKTNQNEINFVINNVNLELMYENQIFLDEKLKINTFIQSNNDNGKIYIKHNWFFQLSDIWDLQYLYEKLVDSSYLGLQLEVIKDKIILVSSYGDLINVFNFMKVNEVDYMFDYDISFIEQNEVDKTRYYKVIIKKYD